MAIMDLTPEHFYTPDFNQPNGTTFPLRVHEFGELHVLNGHVEARAPFARFVEAAVEAVPNADELAASK